MFYKTTLACFRAFIDSLTPLIVVTMRGVNCVLTFMLCYAFLYALKSIAKSLPLIMPSALTSAKAT